MKRSNFTVVCALVVVAITLALKITFQPEPVPVAKAASASAIPKKSPSGMKKFRGNPVRTLSVTPGAARSDGLTVSAGKDSPPSEAGDSSTAEDRASQVEAAARMELARLNESLHLSADQQRKIFPILARSAPGYDPSMVVGGVVGGFASGSSTGGANAVFHDGGTDHTAAIYQELNPDQRAIYEETLIDEGLWWSDILAQIEQGMGVPAAPVGPLLMADPGADEE